MMMFQTKIFEKIKTCIYVQCFFLIVPFEKMWKNTVQQDRPQMTI